MDHVPVAVGLAVGVQPVLQELLLSTAFQAEQMVHVLLAKQTHIKEKLLFTADGRAAHVRGTAVVLRQGSTSRQEKPPPTLSAARVCIHGNSQTLLMERYMEQPLWKTIGCLRSRNVTLVYILEQ